MTARANLKLQFRNFIRAGVYGIMLSALFPLNAQTARPDQHVIPPSSVTFVGCPSDGQLGPELSPVGKPKLVHIPTETAKRLAFYQSERGPGVLAPRGWHCFGTYGSNGEGLYVSPSPISGKDLLSLRMRSFEGPIVQIAFEYGDTSGRWGVAETIARVFPAHRKFAMTVQQESPADGNSIVFGAYPADKLTYKSDSWVEYETPAMSDGLGTSAFRIQKSELPILGTAMLLGPVPNLLDLAVRLDPHDADLIPTIIGYTELTRNALER
jgi:hypothetical protein